MNLPINLKLAKLLKEKGYNNPCSHYYEHALTSRIDGETGNNTGAFGWEKGETHFHSHYFINNIKSVDFSNNNWYMCAAPTIAEVVCWIYSKYQIWVQVSILKDDEWHYSIRRKDNNWNIEFPTKEKYTSMENAYEKGINVVLNTYKPTS